MFEYYYWFDQSPFYIQAARMSVSFSNVPNLYFSAVLNPRIMYEGLKLGQQYTTTCLNKYRRKLSWKQA
jgi:hypothetical protein